MEEDWELLHAADVAVLTNSPKSSAAVLGFFDSSSPTAAGSSEIAAVKSDYFFLDSNLSLGSDAFAEPNSELSLGGNAFPSGSFDELWSDGLLGLEDVSSDSKRMVGDGPNVDFGDGSEDLVTDIEEMVENKESSVVSNAADEAIGGNFQEIGLEATEADEIDGGTVENEEVEAKSDELLNMEENLDKSVVGGGEKKGVVWWKLPLELLKFCAFRLRPVWSIPIAAAIVGVMLFGRRLYRMKHKSRNIPLKLAIDDKKASQLMARAAKLNEAFSVVRRVPVVRSSIPVGGSAPWPLLPLR